MWGMLRTRVYPLRSAPVNHLLHQICITASSTEHFRPKRFLLTSGSNDRPLLVTYDGDSYRFELDINGPVRFSFMPDTVLAEICKSVKTESSDVTKTVAVLDDDGKEITENTTIRDALNYGRPIQIKYGEQKFPVVVARSTGFGDPESEGTTDFHSLLEKSRILALRARLSSIKNRSILFSEFASICEESYIPEAAAKRIATELHQAGIILYFSKIQELSNIVYLKPDEILEDLFSRYGLDSPLQKYLSYRLSMLEEARSKVEAVVEPMKALQKTLDSIAESSANRYIWTMTTSILGGMAGYWYLVYVHFSWDIMEPVTFFTGLGVSTFGYTWWMATNREYEYSNIYDVFLNRAKARGYQRGGFDQKKLKELEARISEIRSEIAEVELKRFQLDAMGTPHSKTQKSEDSSIWKMIEYSGESQSK